MLLLRRIACLLLAGLAVSTSSCVESENPLSDPERAIADGELYGAWTRTEEGDTQILVVGRPSYFTDGNSRFAVKGVPEGIMRYAEIDVGKDRALESAGPVDFFVSKVGRDRYLNVLLYDEHPWPEKEWSKRKLAGYVLARYQVNGERATIWQGDETALAREIKSGKLRGEIAHEGTDSQTVILKETTAKLAKYLEGGGGGVLFPESGKKEYVRMKGVGATK